LTNGAVDFSGPPSYGKHCVGLSRFTNEEGFFVLDLAPDKIRVSPSVKAEMLRMRTQANVQLTGSPIRNVFPSQLQIIAHNARSLHAHLEDVKSDKNFTNSDIMFFSETRAVPSDLDSMLALPDCTTLSGYVLSVL
jgi:ribosomal protein S15P/S13E